jgi:hypothetical protein
MKRDDYKDEEDFEEDNEFPYDEEAMWDFLYPNRNDEDFFDYYVKQIFDNDDIPEGGL